MHSIFTSIVLLFFSITAICQTTETKPISSKFKTENNYKSFLAKPKYKLKAKNAISVLVDDYFTYKSIGIGYQRKFGAFMADAQISKGFGNMNENARENMTDQLNESLASAFTQYIDTLQYNTGIQFGIYKISKAASTSGVLYGISFAYDKFSTSYDAFDQSNGTYVPIKNNFTRIGILPTLGLRAVVYKNFGMCYTFGPAFRMYNMDKSNIAFDEFNGLKKSKSGFWANARLFYAF